MGMLAGEAVCEMQWLVLAMGKMADAQYCQAVRWMVS